MYLRECYRLIKKIGIVCLCIIHTPSVLHITAMQHRPIRIDWGIRHPPAFSCSSGCCSADLNVWVNGIIFRVRKHHLIASPNSLLQLPLKSLLCHLVKELHDKYQRTSIHCGFLFSVSFSWLNQLCAIPHCIPLLSAVD